MTFVHEISREWEGLLECMRIAKTGKACDLGLVSEKFAIIALSTGEPVYLEEAASVIPSTELFPLATFLAFSNS